MSQLPHAQSYRDLLVYQKVRQLAHDIFLLTRTFPKEEVYSLSNQIRRSSRSVGAQIAEAWAKRRYEAHFISKLTDADAENSETEPWLDFAIDCQYLPKEQHERLSQCCQEIGGMIGTMIKLAPTFVISPPY